MTQAARIAIGALAIATLAAATGYWAGMRANPASDAGATTPAAVTADDTHRPEHRILYYRNPMGLPDTSPTPKKDAMGMDYIPVYADEADAETASAKQVGISSEKVQKLGVRTEAASRRQLDRIIRAAGRIEADERRQYAIAAKFEGYIERLRVNMTGQMVDRNQALFDVYSPELISAQREYALASQGLEALGNADSEMRSGMQQLAESSLLRLKNWDVSEEQIRSLAGSGAARRTVTFRSPVAGIVTEKKAVQGMRFMPGEVLYQIADLSTVWAIADVAEQDSGLVRTGATARIRIDAYPDKLFEGAVTYVYPTLKAETRTIPIRVELANPGTRLKPGMFAQVELLVTTATPVLTVPASAVIDSGRRQIVLVQSGEGRFAPREVRLGTRGDSHVEVREGVQEGERVVIAANFLIDAESNLRAAVDGFGQAARSDGRSATSDAAYRSESASGTRPAVEALPADSRRGR